jgi:hypothetical protein
MERAWQNERPQPMKSGLPAPFAWAFIRTWVLASAFVNLLGWFLAAIGHLDALGYGVGFACGVVLLYVWLRREFRGVQIARALSIRWRRWKRPLPLIFAVTFVLICLGAALHPPNNYDALTYRVPQILHWLAAHRWHWIAAGEPHMNITPPGYGWLMAPTLALLKTDRLFALPNLIAFALLPGLYFSVLRQCRVRARVAWNWMWLLPAASCFATQAGGIGNDLLPAVYALAAVTLGCRAAKGRDLQDFWLSALAAALLTGVKVTGAPLALLWVVATLPCWKLVQKRWLVSAVVAATALVISFLPTAAFNTTHTGSWSGDPRNELKIQVNSPIHAVGGNTLMILAGAFEPPLCPVVGPVNSAFKKFELSVFGSWLRQRYERFGIRWGEMAGEESSGIGLGITALAALSFFGGWNPKRSAADLGRWLGLAAYVAFAVYLVKMGSEAAPRLAAPYYPFLLIPLLRARIHERLVRYGWWRVLAALVALSIIPAIILAPSRPLWPAQAVLGRLAARMPGNALLTRSQLVYQVYGFRDNDIAVLKSLLPSDGRAVGYVPEENGIEAPLWKPYGSRTIVQVLPSTLDLSRLRGSVVLGPTAAIQRLFGLTPDEFAAKLGGQIIGKASLYVKVSAGAEEWVVIALDRQAASSTP